MKFYIIFFFINVRSLNYKIQLFMNIFRLHKKYLKDTKILIFRVEKKNEIIIYLKLS